MSYKLFFVFITAFLFIFFVFLQYSSVEAEGDEITFRRPEKILIAQLQIDNPYITSDMDRWMDLLEYYSATRLGLREVPFSQIVNRQGDVKEGISNPEGTTQYMSSEEGVVLIGYLSPSSDVTPSAREKLQEIFAKYSSMYGISESEVEVVNLSLRTFDDEPSVFNYATRDDVLAQEVGGFLEEIEFSDDPYQDLTGEIADLQYANRVNIGNRIEVNLSLRNNDDFTWYIDEGTIFLTTAARGDSNFAINEVWDSFSTPLAVESQAVPSGEEVDITFGLSAEFMPPGDYSESFKFILMPDTEIEGTEFDVDFQILGNGEEVIEVRRAGGLTVFDCPSHTCQDVGTVENGSRHLVLGVEDRWYKINVRGVEGWIAGNYVSRVD